MRHQDLDRARSRLEKLFARRDQRRSYVEDIVDRRGPWADGPDEPRVRDPFRGALFFEVSDVAVVA